MPLRRLLFGLFCAVIVFSSPTAFSQTKSAFAAAFEKYQAGEDVASEFARIADDTTIDTKDRFNAAFVAAVIAIDGQKADDALKHLDAAEALKAGQPQTAIRRAEALTLKKEWKEAQKCLDRAAKSIVAGKKDLSLRLTIAQAELDSAQGMNDKAIQRLEKVAKSAKDRWEVFYNLGRYYEALDKPQDALENYEKVIALDPKTDPYPGIYALQRWAALAMSSDSGSYGRPELAQKAVDRYDAFLKRAEKNRVPEALCEQTRQASDVLKSFVLSKPKK